MSRVLVILILFTLIYSPKLKGQSDPEAVAIADQVMIAMGGKDNWGQTRHIKWIFLDRRLWYWDKWTGDVRCETVDGSMRIAMNIHNKEGSVFMHGEIQTHQDSLAKYLDRGYRMWVNDSYWLVMPFKLQDPGTTLKYMGRQDDNRGVSCDVLEMTFTEVGVTPDNKYLIYVDPARQLVVQWDYFRHYDDEEPRLSTPWIDYNTYGTILLSDRRGERNMGPIAVYKELPGRIYKDASVPATEIQ